MKLVYLYSTTKIGGVCVYIFPFQNGQREGDVVLTLPLNISVDYAIKKF